MSTSRHTIAEDLALNCGAYDLIGALVLEHGPGEQVTLLHIAPSGTEHEIGNRFTLDDPTQPATPGTVWVSSFGRQQGLPQALIDSGLFTETDMRQFGPWMAQHHQLALTETRS